MALKIFAIIGIVVGLISLMFTIRNWNSKQIVDNEKQRWLHLISDILVLIAMLMLLINERFIFFASIALNSIIMVIRKVASEKVRQKASDMNSKVILFYQTHAKDSKKDDAESKD